MMKAIKNLRRSRKGKRKEIWAEITMNLRHKVKPWSQATDKIIRGIAIKAL